MQLRPILLALGATSGLVDCDWFSVPGIPNPKPTTPLVSVDFPDDATPPPGQPVPTARPTPGPRPSGGASAGPSAAPVAGPTESDGTQFTDPRFVDATTKTKFKPDFQFSLDSAVAGSEPGATIDMYQTANELEIREVRGLLERATFRYERLQVGTQIGDGRMDIGTPPKATADVKIVCTETDGRTYAVFSCKASHPLGRVYLSDVKIKDNDGNLQIISISNFSRANDPDGRHTTERSARIIQHLLPGFIVVSPLAGPMRYRFLIGSEQDPNDQNKGAMKVVDGFVSLTP